MRTFDDNFEEACRNLFDDAEFAPSHQLWNKIQTGMQSENLLERTVRQLFEKAEITPSERVWQGISNALHRPIIRPLWRWASAAAVAFLIGGATYYFVSNEETTVQNTDASNPMPQEAKKAENPQNLSEKLVPFTESKTIVSVPSHDKITKIIQEVTQKQVPAQKIVVPVTSEGGGNENNTTLITTADMRFVASPIEGSLLALPIELPTNFSIIKPVPLGLVSSPEIISSETEIQKQYRYWVGVNVGLQDFSPNYKIAETLSSNPFLLQSELSKTNVRTALLDNLQVQSAYSLGIDFARKFGKIWVISAGLQHQSSEYTTHIILKQHTASTLTEASIPDELVVSQSSYGVPVLLGVDWQGKNGMGVFLMTGLQTDFSQSTQISNQFTLAKYNLGIYEKFNFTGVLRIGASYAISEHFCLGLESSYRKALQNIYQTSHLDSRPAWLGLSANLRYRF